MACVTLVLGLASGASAQQSGVQWLTRPDDMAVLWFHDVDRHQGILRLLYSTTPSLPQGQADPEGWRTNVYLVELGEDGAVRQRRLASLHEHLTALVLRRGHEQIAVVRRPLKKGGAQRLQAWSAEDGSILASYPAPRLGGDGPADLAGLVPTTDGRFFITLGGGAETLRWYKFDLDGEVSGQGSLARPGVSSRAMGWFAAHRGGCGSYRSR